MYIPKCISVLIKFKINIITEGTKPKIIINEIIKATNCHLTCSFVLEIPDENFTTDCPNNIIAITDHSVL